MNKEDLVRPKVIVIDDDHELLIILKEVISTVYNCAGFESAAEALEILKGSETFDCLICDLMMPNMDGIKFYHELEIAAPHYLPKLVFLTGGSFTKMSDSFLKKPNISFCEKPVDKKILLNLIQGIINKTTS